MNGNLPIILVVLFAAAITAAAILTPKHESFVDGEKTVIERIDAERKAAEKVDIDAWHRAQTLRMAGFTQAPGEQLPDSEEVPLWLVS